MTQVHLHYHIELYSFTVPFRSVRIVLYRCFNGFEVWSRINVIAFRVNLVTDEVLL